MAPPGLIHPTTAEMTETEFENVDHHQMDEDHEEEVVPVLTATQQEQL